MERVDYFFLPPTWNTPIVNVISQKKLQFVKKIVLVRRFLLSLVSQFSSIRYDVRQDTREMFRKLIVMSNSRVKATVAAEGKGASS